MKKILLLAAIILMGATGAKGIGRNDIDPKELIGTWCLCAIESYENGTLSGGMSMEKDYIEFRADGICVLLASKQEKAYTFDPETGALNFGFRHATIRTLTPDELVWEEVSGATTLRYILRRKSS